MRIIFNRENRDPYRLDLNVTPEELDIMFNSFNLTIINDKTDEKKDFYEQFLIDELRSEIDFFKK